MILNDGQVLHVTATMNQGEIDQATVALARAAADDVRQFAALMLAEHGDALEAATELGEELGLVENLVSARLQDESAAIVNQLESASDAEFDALYMHSQVTVHARVLTLLDEQLIEQAGDEELVTYLESLRASVSEHFDLAAEIADELL